MIDLCSCREFVLLELYVFELALHLKMIFRFTFTRFEHHFWGFKQEHPCPFVGNYVLLIVNFVALMA